MSDLNIIFCRHLLHFSRENLKALVGVSKAHALLRDNLDLVGTKPDFFICWVPDGDVIEKRLYPSHDGYIKADNKYEARSRAVDLLVEHLEELLGEDLPGREDLPGPEVA